MVTTPLLSARWLVDNMYTGNYAFHVQKAEAIVASKEAMQRVHYALQAAGINVSMPYLWGSMLLLTTEKEMPVNSLMLISYDGTLESIWETFVKARHVEAGDWENFGPGAAKILKLV